MDLVEKHIALSFANRVYKVAPDMRLVADIESELGGVDNLLFRFNNGFWKVSDLVSLVHMMLNAAGKTVDYMDLGDKMIEEGLESYLGTARSFLRKIIGN